MIAFALLITISLSILAEGQKEAAKAVANISAEQARMICVQTWERVVANSTVPVYSNHCTGSSAGLLVDTTK